MRYSSPVSFTRAPPRPGVLVLLGTLSWLAAPTVPAAAPPAASAPAQPTAQAPSAAPTSPAPDTPAAPPGHRPRVGLVLSGGGARGAAHVGVLKVLEQMRVPIDAIAGTSMGAVVGGLYASGLSAAEIEKIMNSVNWQDAFRDRPAREDLTLRLKQEDQEFPVKFPLGFRDGKIVLPKGLIQGQRLNQILRRLTLPVVRITDFNQLPTPFHAVATDLETGDTVVMASGDLTSAMRASMSAPGIFAPVERQGRVLVDGGITDNLPVDVARTMGVDVLIVVDVGAPLLPRQKLTEVPVISNQMLAILIRRNVEQQIATLGARDVLIRPPLGDASSFDFGHVGRFIHVGEAAARADSDRFASLAVSEEQMQHYLADRQTLRAPPPVISFVRAESGSEEYSAALDKAFRDLTGKPLDPDALAQRVTALYGQGGLDTLDYQVVSEDHRYGLALDARQSAMGPNYLRFGLTLQDDFLGNSTFNAAVRFVMSDVTRTGGQWVTDVQIGSVGGISTELFVPLQKFSGWFVDPHIADQAYDIDLIQGQALLAEYRAHSFTYGVDFGYQFGNWGEIRTGVQRQEDHFVLKIGDPNDPNLPQLVPGYPESFQSFSLRDYFVRFSYDRLDDVNFPHSGQQARLQLSAYRSVDGAASPANQATLNYTAAHSFGRDTLVLSASGGATFDQQGTFTNAALLFPLGGFLNLSGLRYNSLLGPNYGIGRLIYYHQIGRGGPGYFEVPTYLGMSLEAGNVWQTATPGAFRKDASVFLGLDTFLGPVYLASGFDEHGDTTYYLLLGHTF
jgi:NTE family protein